MVDTFGTMALEYRKKYNSYWWGLTALAGTCIKIVSYGYAN